MELLEFRDDPAWNQTKKVAHPGTFNANPLSAAAGATCLGLIADGGAQRHAADMAARLRVGFNQVLTRRGVPGFTWGESSIFHLVLGRQASNQQGGDLRVPEGVAAETTAVIEAAAAPAAAAADAQGFETAVTATSFGATVPPWSAAHPYTNLYGPKNPTTATVVGNYRVTELGTESDTHHIVLDFGAMPFPVLEGQSIGILPPGVDDRGKPHVARQYSIASPRNGERPGYNNLSLTVKRVTVDHDGNPVRGVCSNYVCDLKKGDTVKVIGPFGASFLMPNHPHSNIVMICTGTGSAPMRAMTEYRRRLRGKFEGGRLMLFFGARTQKELPYFGPLMNLPRDFIDLNFAFSRAPDSPRRYVQDVMRERAADLAALLKDGDTFVYVCGLKSMEAGVLEALRDVATQAGMQWEELAGRLKREGRLHLETY